MVRDTIHTYENGTGNLLSTEYVLDTGQDPILHMQYDEYGNLWKLFDANGNPPTITEYDSTTHTYPWKVTNPLGHVVEYQYDYRNGKVSAKKDENLNWTYHDYDPFGRPKQTSYPDSGQTIWEYYDDVVPRYVITRVRENLSGNTIDKYDYFDGLRRNIQAITHGELEYIVKKNHYDEMGRVARTEGPFFSSQVGYLINAPADSPYINTTYDHRRRPDTVESPLGQDVEQGDKAFTYYNYSGFSTTITDPDGAKKTEKKDHLERIIQVTEFDDSEELNTSYHYNGAGDLLQVTNHLGHIITMSYDTLGRKTGMNDPDMGQWQYTYDLNGNLKTQTDAKGQIITFYYDGLDRVLSKTYSTSDPPATYTYDEPTITNGIGRLYRVGNANASTTYNGYDEMGRELSVTRAIISAPFSSYTTRYGYDLSGKVTSMTYPDGYQVSLTFYPGSGLLREVKGASDSINYAICEQYEPTGKIGYLYHENGTHTTYTYAPESARLLTIDTQEPGLGSIQHRTYRYSKGGDVVKIIDDIKDITYNYTYDSLHRLISEINSGISNPYAAAMLVNTYDENAPVHAADTITYNGADFSYTYDANGNMTNGPDFTDPAQAATKMISFNADNMPLHIEHTKGGNTVITDLFYDGDATRVKKAVQGGSTTYYIGEHFEVKDGIGTKYIFAGNLRVAKVTPSVTYYYHKDHLGSSTVMTSYPAGSSVETTDYLPFGHQREHTGTVVTDYKFTDQELDTESGLYNYDTRLYDPLIGRFINPDSIVPDWYDPQSLNPYSYCLNNPLVYTDPSGHFRVGSTEVHGVNLALGLVESLETIGLGLTGLAAPFGGFEVGGLPGAIATTTTITPAFIGAAALKAKSAVHNFKEAFEPVHKEPVVPVDPSFYGVGTEFGYDRDDKDKKDEQGKLDKSATDDTSASESGTSEVDGGDGQGEAGGNQAAGGESSGSGVGGGTAEDNDGVDGQQ
jgi:RHS repeat-associated protein